MGEQCSAELLAVKLLKIGDIHHTEEAHQFEGKESFLMCVPLGREERSQFLLFTLSSHFHFCVIVQEFISQQLFSYVLTHTHTS
jgi:hypothetical protein